MSKPKLTNNKKLKSLRERNAKLVNKTVDTSRSFAEKALEYNRDIWLAGLGAFATAREESSELFQKLVDKGASLEERSRDLVNESSDTAVQRVGELLDKIPTASEKLEDVFDTRVARALQKLGVPTFNVLRSLSAQIEELAANIEELTGSVEETKKRVAPKQSARVAARKIPAKATPVPAPAKRAVKPRAKKASPGPATTTAAEA